MAQQKTLQMLPRFRQYSACRRPRPHQVPHRFMRSIGDPDGRQFTGAVQLGQHQRVSTIGLYSVSSLHRDQ
jgi:hypothetical protein